MGEKVAAGDAVILAEDEGRRYLVTAGDKVQKVKGVGVLDPANLVGLPWGDAYTVGQKTFRVLPPGYADHAAALKRKAQIILPKDASRLLWELDVTAGKHVVESGIGSGALTLALARAVSPGGRVTVVEQREDFADWARTNLERASVLDVVDVHLGDVTEGIPVTGVDAVVLDVPNPWDAVDHAYAALKGGGYLACYTPLVSQMEQAHRTMVDTGFFDVTTLELMERTWKVGERGSRPDHRMLGHTAFLTTGRKVV